MNLPFMSSISICSFGNCAKLASPASVSPTTGMGNNSRKANNAVSSLTMGVDPVLMKPPVNVLRLALHPAGLAPRIINVVEWRRHIIGRLHQQIELTGDTVLIDLVEEVRDYPLPPGPPGRARPRDHEIVAVPLQLATVHGPLSFFNTTTIFGTSVDITLSELSIETFFPADQATASLMRQMADRTLPPLPVRLQREVLRSASG